MRHTLKLTVITLVFFTGIALVSPVLAQNKVASRAAERQENKLENIKGKGNKAIDERVQKLQAITNRLPTLKFLPDSTRSALLGEIASSSAGLSNLKAKLDADANVTDARADYKKIFTDFRVYMVLIPKVRAATLLARLDAHITNLETFGLKLKARIQKATDEGKDTTGLLDQYNQYNQKVADAKAKVAQAKGLLPQLTVANAASSKQTLVTIRSLLKDAHTDVKDAHKFARNIVSNLKSLKGKQPTTATQSATSSAKP